MNAALQAVFERFMPSYLQHHRLSPDQGRVCAHIRDCRTDVLGGLQWQCSHCDYQQPRYHSCRDRHCPQCQHRATRAWADKQQRAVLPVSYYHLVFTLPHALNPWMARHHAVIYRLLFHCAWETLKQFAHDPQRLDGQAGMTAVLHTWGQNLSRHVHLHCLVPGGVLTEAGHWHAARSNYLFPVKALSRCFRGKMVSALRQAWTAGELSGVDTEEIDTVLDLLMAKDWVVYTKAWYRQADTVVSYLSRYSHKIALSDSRIKAIHGDRVSLHYKDYKRGGRHKTLSLSGEELIRRFLQHVLPKGFMRIRHFGFLANRCRGTKLAQIRRALKVPVVNEEDSGGKDDSMGKMLSPCAEVTRCPRCHQRQWRVVAEIAPQRRMKRR